MQSVVGPGGVQEVTIAVRGGDATAAEVMCDEIIDMMNRQMR
jgi:hypothetical protein